MDTGKATPEVKELADDVFALQNEMKVRGLPCLRRALRGGFSGGFNDGLGARCPLALDALERAPRLFVQKTRHV